MQEYLTKLDKRELLLVIGRLSGEIEKTANALERIAYMVESSHFHRMCLAQTEAAWETYNEFICFTWLAVNWTIHSQPEIEEEISKIPASKFLEIIFRFGQEVDQGINDLESIAEWLIESTSSYECPLEGDEILQSMREALLQSKQDGLVDCQEHAGSHFSEKEKLAYGYLIQANDSNQTLHEFSYFINLAVESSYSAPQPLTPKTEFPLFGFCSAS